MGALGAVFNEYPNKSATCCQKLDLSSCVLFYPIERYAFTNVITLVKIHLIGEEGALEEVAFSLTIKGNLISNEISYNLQYGD